jgi:hypothetical protein
MIAVEATAPERVDRAHLNEAVMPHIDTHGDRNVR